MWGDRVYWLISRLGRLTKGRVKVSEAFKAKGGALEEDKCIVLAS